MSVEESKKIDIPQSLKPEIKQEETLDQILQSKITDDVILQKAKPIFEEVQKSFQLPINEQIKGLDNFQMEYIINIEENPISYLIEYIDIATGGQIMNVIEETSNTVEETSNTVEETSNTVEETSNTVEEKQENKEMYNTFLEAREATKQSYDKLDSKYKITDEQLQKEKGNIRVEVINQITEKTKGTQFSTDDYLKFYLTANTNREALQGTEFMKNYEALSNILNIPPAVTTMKKMSTNADQVNAIVNSNTALTNYSTNSSKLNTLTIPDLPKTKNIKQEFKLYVKLISDEQTRTSIQENKKLILKYNPKKENKEEVIKAYTEYQQAITQVQEQLPERIKNISKQRVLGSCITGLAKYFDTTTINQQNFADDFDINTQNGFDIQKGRKTYNEQWDDILSIKGNINGNTIGFHYNLDNPDAELKSDDSLSLDTISNVFSLGIENGWQKKLWVKLPTINFLANEAQSVIDKNFTDELGKADSLEDFEATLKNKISKNLSKNYGEKALVKTRVTRDIEKNITIQTLQNTFIPWPVLAELNNGEAKNINNTTETTARNILKIRDKTTENMRSDELRRFRLLTQNFNKETQQNNHPNLEKKRENLLQGIKSEQQAISYNQRGTSIEKFFNTITDKNGKINIQDFEKIVDILEKNEDIEKNINKFSPEFQTQNEQASATEILNLDNDTLRNTETNLA